MIGRFLVPTAIVLGLFVYMHGGGAKGATASVAQACGDTAGTVNVAITWPAPAVAPEETWVDVGLTPAFAAGTFRGYGPIAPPATTVPVGALPDGFKLYYRVNMKTQAGWLSQAAGSFTTGCAQAVSVTPTPAVNVVDSGP